jgi:LruC domain-containing protein
MKTFNLYLLLTFLTIFTACVPDADIENSQSENNTGTTIANFEKLSIPDNFNFETERAVTLSISDATPFVKYEVFAYAENNSSEEENITEALKNSLYSGKPYNGEINQSLSLSSIYTKVYVVRKDGLEYTSKIVPIINNQITSKSTNKTSSKTTNAAKTNSDACSICKDNFFLNNDFENGPTLPSSYVITDEKNVDGWSTTARDNAIEIWKSGFNDVPAQNGTYFAELNANLSSALYQRICTSPGAQISWSVWHRGRVGVNNAVVRIGENLATATVEATMKTGNTAWVKYSGTYKVPTNQQDTYFIFESLDAGSYGNFIDNIEIKEIAPGDCSKVQNKMYYPTELTNATLAFEDLWPYTGDYDFNDLVISYNIKTILNAENKVTQLDYNYTLESIGASFTNGFGLELEGVLPSAIESVTGQNLTEGFIQNNANGTEKSQSNAVIIFFDNSHKNVGLSKTISIKFTTPITTAALGTAPFNPFLIVNKDRKKEIHLPGKSTTNYPKTTTIPTGPTVKDSDGNFKTPSGLPWAINISGAYRAPKEKVLITDAYKYFAAWATSGGTEKSDWFLDKSGYRNNEKLK